MNKWKNYVTSAALLAGLFLIGSVMWSPQSQVHGAFSSPVSVMNTTSAPAIASLIDDPGRVAYQSGAAPTSFTITGDGMKFVFPAVPAGHRLVVQHASGQFTTTNTLAGLITVGPGTSASLIPISNFFTSTFGTFNAFDQPVLFYVEPGFMPVLFAFGPTWNQGANQSATLSGYMLDCTAAPCPAIAH
jgi:hypothetical protein